MNGVNPNPLMTLGKGSNHLSIQRAKMIIRTDSHRSERDDRRGADEEGPEEDQVQLGIFDGLPELIPLEFGVLSGSVLLGDPVDGDFPFLGRQKPGRRRRDGNDGDEDESDNDRDGSSDQERDFETFEGGAGDAAAPIQKECTDDLLKRREEEGQDEG